MNTPQPGEFYRHHSGTLYEVLQPVFDADTGEQLVMYREVRKSLLHAQNECEPEYEAHGKRYIHTIENFTKPGRFERR